MFSTDLSLVLLDYLDRSCHQELSQVSPWWARVVDQWYYYWALKLTNHERLGQMPLAVRSKYLRWGRLRSIAGDIWPLDQVPAHILFRLDGEPIYLTLDHHLLGEQVPIRDASYYRIESGEVILLLQGMDGQGYLSAQGQTIPLDCEVIQVEQMVFLTGEGELHLCFPHYLIMEGTRFINMAVSQDQEAIFVVAVSDKRELWTFAVQEGEVVLTQRRLPLCPVVQVKSLPRGIFIMLMEDGSLEVTTYYFQSLVAITRLLSETMQRDAPEGLTEIRLWGPGVGPYSYYLQDGDGRLWDLNLISYQVQPTPYHWWNCPVDGFMIEINEPESGI